MANNPVIQPKDEGLFGKLSGLFIWTQLIQSIDEIFTALPHLEKFFLGRFVSRMIKALLFFISAILFVASLLVVLAVLFGIYKMSTTLLFVPAFFIIVATLAVVAFVADEFQKAQNKLKQVGGTVMMLIALACLPLISGMVFLTFIVGLPLTLAAVIYLLVGTVVVGVVLAAVILFYHPEKIKKDNSLKKGG